jgi:hypothetical protein
MGVVIKVAALTELAPPITEASSSSCILLRPDGNYLGEEGASKDLNIAVFKRRPTKKKVRSSVVRHGNTDLSRFTVPWKSVATTLTTALLMPKSDSNQLVLILNRESTGAVWPESGCAALH